MTGFIKRRNPLRKRNKFNAETCSCYQNHLHDSRKEAGYCNRLAMLVKAKLIKGYKSQVTFNMYVNGKRITGHRVDFVVTTNEGTEEAHEVKGFATDVWILKKKLFEALYPHIPYKVIR